jgi:hypothetical protein
MKDIIIKHDGNHKIIFKQGDKVLFVWHLINQVSEVYLSEISKAANK